MKLLTQDDQKKEENGPKLADQLKNRWKCATLEQMKKIDPVNEEMKQQKLKIMEVEKVRNKLRQSDFRIQLLEAKKMMLEAGLEMMEAREELKQHKLMEMEQSIVYAQENLEPYEMDEVGELIPEKPTEARAIMSIVHSDMIKPKVTKVMLYGNSTNDIGIQEWTLPQMFQMEELIHQKATCRREPILCRA